MVYKSKHCRQIKKGYPYIGRLHREDCRAQDGRPTMGMSDMCENLLRPYIQPGENNERQTSLCTKCLSGGLCSPNLGETINGSLEIELKQLA